MKRFLISAIIILSGAIPAFCEGNWMEIEFSNESPVRMSIDGLVINAADNKLYCSDAQTSLEVDIEKVVALRFETDSTGVNSAVEDADVMVFNDKGLAFGHFNSIDEARKAISTPGIYIFKFGSHSIKYILK